MPTCRLMFVGAGAIAEIHLRVLNHWTDANEIDVCVTDVNADALDRFVASRPSVKPYATLEDMLAGPPEATDIVVVATPPLAHEAPALQALASGRHVLCEKPLAMDRDEARAMGLAARRAGRLVGCCSNRFLGAGMAELRERLAGDGFGTLYRGRWQCRMRRRRSGVEYQPQSRWFLKRAISGGGVLMDWGPYDITTLCYLLQPTRIEVLSADVARPIVGGDLPDFEPDVEFHVAACLRVHREAGPPLTVDYERGSALHGEESEVFEFDGTRGAASVHWLPRREDGCGFVHAWDEQGQTKRQDHLTIDEPKDPMLRPLTQFRRAISGGESAIALGDQAVFNFAVIQAIYRVAETGEPSAVDLAEVMS